MFRLAAAQNSAQKSLKFLTILRYGSKFSEFFDSNFAQLRSTVIFKQFLNNLTYNV